MLETSKKNSDGEWVVVASLASAIHCYICGNIPNGLWQDNWVIRGTILGKELFAERVYRRTGHHHYRIFTDDWSITYVFEQKRYKERGWIGTGDIQQWLEDAALFKLALS